MDIKNMTKDTVKCESCDMGKVESQEHLMSWTWMDLDILRIEDQLEFGVMKKRKDEKPAEVGSSVEDS